MCRSNVIIYHNAIKFEIYCNDKTESHHMTEHFLKVVMKTITWLWTKSLIIHTVTFRGIVNVENIYCEFFSCDFFSYLIQHNAGHGYLVFLNHFIISHLCHYL